MKTLLFYGSLMLGGLGVAGCSGLSSGEFISVVSLALLAAYIVITGLANKGGGR